MNRISFEESACEKTRKYLDSYISSELSIETSHEILRHLETCSPCAAESDVRLRLRSRLKAAIEAQSVPPEMRIRIRSKIVRSHPWSWTSLGMAGMAAALMISVGVWLIDSPIAIPALTDRPAQQTYIQRISAGLAGVLKAGLSDHVHCSVFRRYPKTPPQPETMASELGPSYRRLLPIVRTAIPSGYAIVMAHQCSFAGRHYIHLTLARGSNYLSVVVAHRNPGETLGGLSAAAELSGISIYQSRADRYRVAGFEAGDYLAYVISDLDDKTNLQVAMDLAPGVHEFLMKTPA